MNGNAATIFPNTGNKRKRKRRRRRLFDEFQTLVPGGNAEKAAPTQVQLTGNANKQAENVEQEKSRLAVHAKQAVATKESAACHKQAEPVNGELKVNPQTSSNSQGGSGESAVMSAQTYKKN